MLCDEKDAAVERAAVSEYELRLAREDLRSLQNKLEQQAEARPHSNDYGITLLVWLSPHHLDHPGFLILQ